MVKQYKKGLIASSLVILLPMALGLLFWNQLPSLFPSHIGFDGQPDAWQGKAFGVFFLPLILLAAHWLCLFITWKDPKNKGRNHKMFRLVLWIMPMVSLYANAIVYCTAFGYGLNVNLMSIVPMGAMFVVIGNYLPKCQQNRTIGIKIPWTLANEENWNLTHRFGGKCWVIGGLAMILCVFLPEFLGFTILLTAMFILALAPIIYSYTIYRRHKKQGIVYPIFPLFSSKKAAWISVSLLTVFLIFIAALMFTGDLTYAFREEGFTIEADFYADLAVSYDAIDSVIYHPGNVPGTRTNGFGSAKLLMGSFYSEELGHHTRYSYTKPESCIILTCGEKTLVLSGRDAAETEHIYQWILSQME